MSYEEKVELEKVGRLRATLSMTFIASEHQDKSCCRLLLNHFCLAAKSGKKLIGTTRNI